MLFGVQQGRKLARFPIGKSHGEVRFSKFSRLRRTQKAIFTPNSPPQAENFGILHLIAKLEGFGALLDTTRDPDLRLSF